MDTVADTSHAMAGSQALDVSLSGTRSENTVLSFTMSIGNKNSDLIIQDRAEPQVFKGTKRPYSAVNEIPTPSLSASFFSDRLGASLSETGPQYLEGDSNSEFEFIRMPKNRSYDLVKVPKTSSLERSQANVPLTATRHDGINVVIWAKMDTGADTNFINFSVLKALLGEEQAEKTMYPLADDEPTYNLVGSNHIAFAHRARLSFYAGRSNKYFENVSFVVYHDVHIPGSSTDGVPNVIIGITDLQKYSMIMVDFEYHVDRDPELPVISPKAESENPEFRTVGPIIRGPKAPGIRFSR